MAPFCSGCVLMSAIDRAVDAVPLVIVVPTEPFEQALPDTLACPAVEPIEHCLPRTELAGQISPRSACAPPPQHGLHEVTVVPPGPSGSPSSHPARPRSSATAARLAANEPSCRSMQHTRSSMESLACTGSCPRRPRRALPRPKPLTNKRPDDSLRTIGHGHGHVHVYG